MKFQVGDRVIWNHHPTGLNLYTSKPKTYKGCVILAMTPMKATLKLPDGTVRTGLKSNMILDVR